MVPFSGVLAAAAFSAIPEPFPFYQNGSFTGAAQNASRDPFVQYQWDESADYQHLQAFAAAPMGAAAAPPAAVTELYTLTLIPYGYGSAVVSSNTSILFDWGVETAGWLEFSTGGQVGQDVSFTAAVSEFNALSPEQPAVQPTLYGTNEYRLETNKQLYNGVRYGWLNVFFSSSCFASSGMNACPPLTLTGVRVVAQILPLNYTGSFSSSDPVLDAIWYTGAYSVRVNLLPGFFGSELLDRGDRIPPFQGDAHVAQSVGLTAFGSPPMTYLVRTMLNLTDSAARSVHDSNIVTYPLMWVLSVVEYYTVTGDWEALLGFAPDMSTIIDGCAADFQSTTSPPDQRWSGWDDRLGSGFYDVNQTPESRRFYWMTTLRAANRFSSAASQHGGPLQPYADKYASLVANLTARLRGSGADWAITGGYGIHALAAAVNGGWTTHEEEVSFFTLAFNSSSAACSWSNYDTGFILSALGLMGHVDFATALLHMCWANQLSAGATCWWEASVETDFMLQNGGQGKAGDVDVITGVATSLCHAWGSYPTTWMTQNLAGLRPLAAGYATFTVAPLLGNIQPWLTSVSGAVNTPHGIIKVEAASSLQMTSEAIDVMDIVTVVTFPLGTAPELRLQSVLPGSSRSRSLSSTSSSSSLQSVKYTLMCNDTEEGAESREGEVDVASLPTIGTSAGLDRVVLHGMGVCPGAGGPARLTVRATYRLDLKSAQSGAQSSSPFPPYSPPVWPATFLGLDNVTRGDWVGRYGRDGYVLFAFDGPSTARMDRASLPSYITNYTCGSPTTGVMTRSPPSPSVPTTAYLTDPTTTRAGASVGLGGIAGVQMYDSWCDFNTAVGSPPFNLSLYFVDLGLAGPEASGGVVVRVEDSVTRDGVAPDVLLRHYVAPPAYGGDVPPFNAGGSWGLENGIYASYIPVQGRSARVRLYCMGTGSCSSTMSAAFFDA